MKLNFFNAFYSKKQQRWCPGLQPMVLDDISFDNILRDPRVKALVADYQSGKKEAKTQLPAICWCGYCKEGTTRKAENMIPTQLYMVDIDHVENPAQAWEEIRAKVIFEMNLKDYGIVLSHITPSGHGLRLVCRAKQDFPTLQQHMEWICNGLNLTKYGDFDGCVKDLSRLSFAVPEDYVLYRSTELFSDPAVTPIKEAAVASLLPQSETSVQPLESADDEAVHKEEYEGYKTYEYRGTLLTTIIDKYLQEYGTPGDGERHNYYNNMVKNFRCITDNNVRVLHALLPRFGHGYMETLSQVQSICRTNTLSRLPREFWLFLYHNDFWKKSVSGTEQQIDEYLLNAPAKSNPGLDDMPTLPPVFREIVGAMPKDFVIPTINGLMPIMGTLASHLQAEYPFDRRMHSCEFFSIVYAPPGTGKSWLEGHMNLIFEDLKLRDLISNEREALYNRLINRKGSNEKAPDNPRVTLRIVMPKQSETDFLEKQQANKGHHMFTYAPEMDAWRKGVKAAGGNKDDMIRIAWDNGEYGQNFKSANSFKGVVNLFWNVFICGTLDQINAYFTNVSNGLVTRCCFTPIENQEFVDAPAFKKLTKREVATIEKWRTRMDEENYKEPLNFDPEILFAVNEEDFDKEVPWRYEFKPKKTVDLGWIMPTLKAFLKQELERSALDQDHARDAFRRRVAVRGFRLALLCTSLYVKVGEREKKIIKDFVAWWMPQDLRGIMTLFADRYNEEYDKNLGIKVTQKGLYDLLPKEFSKADVYTAAKKLGKKTKPRRIIFDWKALKAITQIEEDKYRKNR